MKMKQLFAAILAAAAFSAFAQSGTAKDLSPLLQANKWTLERAAVKAVNAAAEIDGASVQALKLTYTVNHKQKDGTIKPGGWPYANYLKLPADQNDWSSYKKLDMKIRARFNRVDEDKLPFVIAIIPAAGARVDTTVNLVQDKWIDVSIPLDKFENLQINDIKLFLNGTKYKHDDVLTVEIAKPQLSR